MPKKPGLIAAVAALFCLAGALPAGASTEPHGTPDNGPIAFGRANPQLGGSAKSLWVARADGSHQQQLTRDETGFSDWSPDGRRIAFDFVSDTGVHIATMSPEGKGRRSLTSAPGVQEGPKWSPDGRLIAYDAFAAGQDPFAVSIWVMRSDGTDPHELTQGFIDVEPVFSPDGTRIAFGRITGDSPEGQLEAVNVVNVDGTGLHEILAPRAGLEHPDWSPDGRLISFNIAPESGSAPDSGAILAVRPDGTGLKVVRPPSDGLRFFKPVWSPDGRQLLTGCFDTKIRKDRICTISDQGKGKIRVVIAGDADVNLPSWGARRSG